MGPIHRKTGRVWLATAVALYVALSVTIAAAKPSATAQQEVAHLLDYLARSGCEFYRNGAWHPAPDARAHLEKKYRYLLDRNRIDTAEHFIERAATGSSISGKPYQVRCGNDGSVESAAWLTQELRRYRETQKGIGRDSARPQD